MHQVLGANHQMTPNDSTYSPLFKVAVSRTAFLVNLIFTLLRVNSHRFEIAVIHSLQYIFGSDLYAHLCAHSS